MQAKRSETSCQTTLRIDAEAFSIYRAGASYIWMIDDKSFRGCLSLFSRNDSSIGLGAAPTWPPGSHATVGHSDAFARETLFCTIYIDAHNSSLLMRWVAASDHSLQEIEIKTTCELLLYDPAPIQGIQGAFVAYPLALKLVLKSDVLKDCLSSFDDTTAHLHIKCSLESIRGDRIQLQLSGDGTLSKVSVSLDESLMESWEGPGLLEQPVQYCYQMEKAKGVLKTLSKASRTQLKINSQGILSLQSMIPHGDGQFSFVETLLLPLVEDL
ncbi:hypothetical protein HDU91_004774 [Kappamyces sp. JEL0680]|nr:hypothetical protein HDU91_004774 [Kappamyces sp. JEL0680]